MKHLRENILEENTKRLEPNDTEEEIAGSGEKCEKAVLSNKAGEREKGRHETAKMEELVAVTTKRIRGEPRLYIYLLTKRSGHV